MKLSTSNVSEMIKYWRQIASYTALPRTESDYHKQLRLLNELMHLLEGKKDAVVVSFLEHIARNIEAYEEQNFKLKKASAKEILKFLMQEHQLTQSKLPEIGSQPLVSKILKGDRKLTADRIVKLVKRFNVSPMVFLEN